MIRKTLHSVCIIIASLLMFASAKGVAVPLKNGEIPEVVSRLPEPSPSCAYSLETAPCAIPPSFETLTTVHHLHTIADFAEYSETETEDDDDVSAHYLSTATSLSMRLAASSFANAPPASVIPVTIPLYVLHHSWKHFPSRV